MVKHWLLKNWDRETVKIVLFRLYKLPVWFIPVTVIVFVVGLTFIILAWAGVV